MQGLIRIETCREIKKLYAPWRILKVMDCSVVKFYLLLTLFFSGIIQNNLQHSEEAPKVGKGVARSESYSSGTEEAQQSP